jgi:hypothetical protein
MPAPKMFACADTVVFVTLPHDPAGVLGETDDSVPGALPTCGLVPESPPAWHDASEIAITAQTQASFIRKLSIAGSCARCVVDTDVERACADRQLRTRSTWL